MTDFYKNNDDQIRDKLTEHEFSQVSGAWDNMSKLLDQQHTVPKALVVGGGRCLWLLPLY
jgi:deoxyadenosine/deoxycytidine kinase